MSQPVLFASADPTTVEWRTGGLSDANPLLARAHYLGPTQRASLVVIGVLGVEVVAAQVWSTPTSRRLPSDGSWLELSRWCLTPEAGENAGSRQHRAARRMMPAEVTTLVSYSDPSAGHTGALYRACNWQWWPTWHRLRTPPSGNGAWTEGDRQEVKDRWIFPLRGDERRGPLLALDDEAAIRWWREHGTPDERRWASRHPQLGALLDPKPA